jgi:hypothetical protein
MAYGTDTSMGQLRKITVEVDGADLDAAQKYTGEGVSETIRAALRKFRSAQAQREALKLRGKIKFGVDLMALRKLED